MLPRQQLQTAIQRLKEDPRQGHDLLTLTALTAATQEPFMLPCLDTQRPQDFAAFVARLKAPNRYYVPVLTKDKQVMALVIDLDGSGQANTLFFNPLGGGSDDPYLAESKPIIEALHPTFKTGAVYQTQKEFHADTASGHYSGDWAFWFMVEAAKSYAKRSLKDVLGIERLPLKTILKDPKPAARRAEAVALLERQLLSISAEASVSERRAEEKVELLSQSFPSAQVVHIPTEGNNCPVYCVAEYLISELLKPAERCAFKQNREQVIRTLAAAFKSYLGVPETPDGLVPLLRALDDAHPMKALNAVSDVLIAGPLKTHPRDGHNMLDDRVFDALGKLFGFRVDVHHNASGVKTDSSGLQEPAVDETISLDPMPSSGAESSANGLLNIYYLGTSGSKKHLHFNLLLADEARVRKFNASLRQWGNDFDPMMEKRKPQLGFECVYLLTLQRINEAEALTETLRPLLLDPQLSKKSASIATLKAGIAEWPARVRELRALQEKLVAFKNPLLDAQVEFFPLLERTCKAAEAQLRQWEQLRPVLATAEPSVRVSASHGLPARGRTAFHPARLREEALFKAPPAELGSTKSVYNYYAPRSDREAASVLDQSSISSPVPPEPKQGTMRVGKHLLPKALEKNGLKLTEFTVVDFNKKTNSIDSKIILKKEAQEILQAETDFDELKEAEQQVLLTVVDKQLEDCIATLQAKGKPIVITIGNKLPPVMKQAYQVYCLAMGYKLKDSSGRILVKGDEDKSALPIKKQTIEDCRRAFADLIRKEAPQLFPALL